MEKNLIRIGGMWINKTEQGFTYMSGTWGAVKVLVFKNTKKKPGSKDPDYSLCIAPIEPKEKEKPEAEEDAPF